MNNHLLPMFSFSAFGVCTVSAWDFYEIGLHTETLGLGAIGFILLLVGSFSLHAMEKKAYDQGYLACEEHGREFERLLKEQKERER